LVTPELTPQVNVCQHTNSGSVLGRLAGGLASPSKKDDVMNTEKNSKAPLQLSNIIKTEWRFVSNS
jgi:hypothetical protein